MKTMGKLWSQFFNPLNTIPTKWSNTLKLKQQPTNCMSVFDHFVGLAFKGLNFLEIEISALAINEKHFSEITIIKFSSKLLQFKAIHALWELN